MNHIILAAPSPLQSVLSRVQTLTTSQPGESIMPFEAREAELRVLLTFVLLGAVVVAATVLVPTGVLQQRRDRVS